MILVHDAILGDRVPNTAAVRRILYNLLCFILLVLLALLALRYSYLAVHQKDVDCVGIRGHMGAY